MAIRIKGTDKINEYAVQWWADRLDESHADKREAFKAVLLSKLPVNECDYFNDTYQWKLECDYDPKEILLEALNESGIECTGFMFSAKGIFPQKHILARCGNTLRPKEGYGNWTEEIIFED